MGGLQRLGVWAVLGLMGTVGAVDVPFSLSNQSLGGSVERAAQGAADGFLRQQERDRQLREELERAPAVRLEGDSAAQALDTAAWLPKAEADCVLIQSIELVEEFVEQPADFRWAISAANETGTGERDAALGQCLGSQGVNLVMRRLQNRLIARGLVTARTLQ